MNLSGITIVTGENCKHCTTLINMMNRIKADYRIKTQMELIKMKITVVPTILKDGIRIFEGCPGSVKDLKEVLRR